MKRLIIGLALAGLAVVTAACSSGGGAPAPGGSATVTGRRHCDDRREGPQVPDHVDHRPGRRGLRDRAGQPGGAPHNIADLGCLRDRACSRARSCTATKVTNAIPALAAGTYPFICEVHPDMKGTITAE